jgi:DNA-binding GntR family transcriptional regulator
MTIERNDPAQALGTITDGPIVWRSLHETVTGRLRDMIVEGHLAEGSRIIERELCERLGVSRTPLREAFKVLAGEGLVEIQPNRGAVVTRIGPREARDMLVVIARLEALAAELACANATDADMSALRTMHDRMVAHYGRRERLESFHLNQEIHLAIVRLAGNEPLRTAHGRLHARMKRIRFRGNDIPENWATAVKDHEDLMAALERRDAGQAGAIVQRHLETSWLRLADSMAFDPVTLQSRTKETAS